MFTQVYKPIQLTGIILCSLMLVLSSCKDSALSGESEQLNAKNKEIATSTSGETIQVAKASTARDVYWTGETRRTGETIIARSYVDEQGSKQTEVLYRLADLGSITPYGVAVDLEDQMLYFSDEDGGMIGRTALDGNGSVDTLYSVEDGVEFPGYLALNLTNDTIIWTDQSGILKGSLDGTAAVSTVYSSLDGIDRSVGIDLLWIGDILYWNEVLSGEIVAGRAQGDIDPYVLFEKDDASPAIRSLLDLEVDLLSGHLYVSDGTNDLNSRILRGHLDGAGSLETIYEGEEGFASASSLTIDRLGRKLYWSQSDAASFSGTILRGSLDGSDTPELVYDLRDFEDEGIDKITSIAIGDPLGLKGKTAGEEQQEVVYLHF